MKIHAYYPIFRRKRLIWELHGIKRPLNNREGKQSPTHRDNLKLAQRSAESVRELDRQQVGHHTVH
jgi:hypothetical protein